MPSDLGCAGCLRALCSERVLARHRAPVIDMARQHRSLTTSQGGVALGVAATSSWEMVEVLRVS